jgi:hypothetical protein
MNLAVCGRFAAGNNDASTPTIAAGTRLRNNPRGAAIARLGVTRTLNPVLP